MVREILGQRREGKHRFVRNIGELIEKDTARLEREGKLNPPAEEAPAASPGVEKKLLQLTDHLYEGNVMQCQDYFSPMSPIWFPSAADYYRLFKQVKETGMGDGSRMVFVDDLLHASSCMLTSTRINLTGDPANGEFANVKHNFGKNARTRSFPLPAIASDPTAKDMADCLQAVFDTDDSFDMIQGVFYNAIGGTAMNKVYGPMPFAQWSADKSRDRYAFAFGRSADMEDGIAMILDFNHDIDAMGRARGMNYF